MNSSYLFLGLSDIAYVRGSLGCLEFGSLPLLSHFSIFQLSSAANPENQAPSIQGSRALGGGQLLPMGSGENYCLDSSAVHEIGLLNRVRLSANEQLGDLGNKRDLVYC